MADQNYSFSQKVLIFISLSAFILLLIFFLGYVINILLLIFAGILIAVFLRALSRLLQKVVPVSEPISLLLVIMSLLIIVAGFVMIVGPNISESISNLEKKIPLSLQKLEDTIKQYSWGNSLVNNLKSNAKNFLQNSQISTRIMGAFSSTLTALLNIVLILVVGIYGAYDPKLYTRNFLKLLPGKNQRRGEEIIDILENALIWWMVGRLSSMAVIGILTIIGLWILGIPLPIFLGIFAAVLTFVPNIGPFISAVPAVLFGLIESPQKALYVILLYTGIQVVESYFITPLIQKKAVSLPPALLISFQIIIGVLLGIFGLVLATPLLVVIIVLVQTIYVEGILNQDVTVLGEANTKV